MGKLLAETERAKGARGIGPIAVTSGDRNTPTLSELGITRREDGEIAGGDRTGHGRRCSKNSVSACYRVSPSEGAE